MNRLSHETSPYLLQHADNPVHWHPWDDRALALARDEDKPILLSVGYSACHWCHVMAHESFEDEATAAIMNELFVNIKVDREERPDLDRIYQIAHQMFTGRAGGWPLTVFLTPREHLPIFAGTYFPKSSNYGMPAFNDVLTRVESYYRTHLPDIQSAGQTLLKTFAKLEGDAVEADQALGHAVIEAARQRLADSFDNQHGGFGGAPKFPQPSNLDFLLGCDGATQATEDTGARQIVVQSLRQMADRGLYDHLGGGFFRYSVDERWEIPHFEKMLYDNAALLATYSRAFARYGTVLFASVASATADWLLRDMQHDEGAFFATLDADSEGKEGKFYVWQPEQFDAVLEPDESAFAKRHFGLERAANFESEAWHLQRAPGDADLADDPEVLQTCRDKLLAARNQRVWPGRDDKLLAAWNGMAIGALAQAARHLGRPELASAARRAAQFMRAKLWDGRRLKATYKDGRARFAAYLDDYAFLAQGLLELLQTDWRSADLEFAIELTETLLAHFSDPRGGFFFTADDHERLIHRPKPLGDEAIPSGNGVAALLLFELGHLIGEPRYLDAASATLHAAQSSIERYPEAHTTLLRALRYQLEPPELVIVRAPAEQLRDWRDALAGQSLERLCFLIPDAATQLPGALAERRSETGAAAYLCRGTACSAPIHAAAELKAELRAPT